MVLGLDFCRRLVHEKLEMNVSSSGTENIQKKSKYITNLKKIVDEIDFWHTMVREAANFFLNARPLLYTIFFKLSVYNIKLFNRSKHKNKKAHRNPLDLFGLNSISKKIQTKN